MLLLQLALDAKGQSDGISEGELIVLDLSLASVSPRCARLRCAVLCCAYGSLIE